MTVWAPYIGAQGTNGRNRGRQGNPDNYGVFVTRLSSSRGLTMAKIMIHLRAVSREAALSNSECNEN